MNGAIGIFQPTPPVWAETDIPQCVTQHKVISTHSARVGGDMSGVSIMRISSGFQPTPPVWAETEARIAELDSKVISTHSARGGGD